MNDQSKMMNQAQIMAAMSQAPPPMMMMSQIGQPSQPMMMNPNQPPPMMNRVGGYNKVWSQQQQAPMNPNFSGRMNNNNKNNWKGKKNGNDPRRIDNNNLLAPAMSYKPPTLHELQSQNRAKARKFYPNNNKARKFNNRFAPYAPRNTTSFIIRAKKSGGIASLVSPSPATPAVLPTPMFSPSREVLGDMAKEEWGVDGYGSMKGLIRLRSPGNDEEEEEEGGSGESDVEEHVEVERRLDHDLSRFEMIYPNYSGTEYNNVLENRVDDQDSHIAQLEDENLTLKERLFLMEREMGDLRRRLLLLERRSCIVAGDVHEEVVENESENESEGPGTSSAKNNNNQNQSREGTEDVKEERETGDAFMGDSDRPRDDDDVVVAVENDAEVEEEEEDNPTENNGDSVKEEEARTKSL